MTAADIIIPLTLAKYSWFNKTNFLDYLRVASRNGTAYKTKFGNGNPNGTSIAYLEPGGKGSSFLPEWLRVFSTNLDETLRNL